MLHRLRAAFGDRYKILAAIVVALVVFPLCLQGVRLERQLELQVELSTSLDHPTQAEVFWRTVRNPGEFSQENSAPFAVNPGANNQRRVKVPDDVTSLRLDPIGESGHIRITRMGLYGPFGIPLQRWDATRGFAGWVPMVDLSGMEVRDGALQMDSTNIDPNLTIDDLTDVRRKTQELKWGLWGALALALSLFLHLVVTTLVGRGARAGATSASDAPDPATPPPKRTRAQRRLLFFKLSTLGISALVGAVILYAAWRLLRPEPSAAFSTYGYSTTLVDQHGQPLSSKPGEVELVLDPLSGFRHLPNQEAELFTIDARGFRGPPPKEDRPLAIVVGGSTAFGQGLTSDSETFSAQLNEIEPRYAYANAAVIGFASAQELGLMVHHLDDFHPKLYIVMDGWNDLNSQLVHSGVRWPTYGINQQMFSETEQSLRAKVPFTPSSKAPAPQPISDSDNLELILSTYGENLKRMQRFATASGAELLVVFQPELGNKHRSKAEEEHWNAERGHMGPGFSEKYRLLIERTRTLCEASHMNCLDLNDAPEIRDHSGDLFVDVVHLNRAGHRIMAEVIARHLAPQDEQKRQ